MWSGRPNITAGPALVMHVVVTLDDDRSPEGDSNTSPTIFEDDLREIRGFSDLNTGEDSRLNSSDNIGETVQIDGDRPSRGRRLGGGSDGGGDASGLERPGARGTGEQKSGMLVGSEKRERESSTKRGPRILEEPVQARSAAQTGGLGARIRNYLGSNTNLTLPTNLPTNTSTPPLNWPQLRFPL